MSDNDSHSLTLVFPEASTAEGNQLAVDLRDCLRDINGNVQVERLRDNPDTMDFGATLGLILGSAAVIAVAKGIAAWLARNSGVRLEIRQSDGSVAILTNLDSRDVFRIAQAISHRG
jgi:hypothetical protein